MITFYIIKWYYSTDINHNELQYGEHTNIQNNRNQIQYNKVFDTLWNNKQYSN